MHYHAVGLTKQDLHNGIDFLKNAESTYGLTFVSSNICHKDNNRPIFQPYIINKEAGLKVGVFGLTDEAFWRDQKMMDTLGIAIQPYRQVAPQMVKKLRSKVHYLIVLTDLRKNMLDSLLVSNPGIDMALTTGSYKIGVRQVKECDGLVVGTGSRGPSGTMVEIPFDPQHPDTVIYREVQLLLTEDVETDSSLEKLIAQCTQKAKDQIKSTYQSRKSPTQRTRTPTKQEAAKANKQPVKKSPFSKPADKPVPTEQGADKQPTTQGG
jgi:2',3'-cyclic-nucleotide 2'-phosphodiesterase (5'-nucleotidase family)